MTRDDRAFYARLFASLYIFIMLAAIVIGVLLALNALLGAMWGLIVFALLMPPMLFGCIVVVDKLDRWV